MIYNVQDYGAVGNGVHDDTSAIQSAIDACFASGGGQVLLSGSHIYRSGTIVLRSNIDFHIDKDTVLKASDNISDFDPSGNYNANEAKVTVPTYESCEYSGSPTLFFIYAKDASDITVSGEGTIDGNEEIFYGTVTPWHIDGAFYPRVPMLFLENIEGLTITGITLRRSAFWTIHPVGCRNIRIEDITIDNNRILANCDGIDPDHCRNVSISRCRISTADDCIVFKNTEYGMDYGPCEDITVTDCDLSSTSAAIKFGTESEDLFRNINIRDIRITDTNRGISLQLRDSGSIEDVNFHNITIDTRFVSQKHWWGDAEPIAITAVKRNSGTNIGHISNISFNNITCNSDNGILIYGDESVNIGNISFRNLTLNIKDDAQERRDEHDLRPCDDIPFVKAKPERFFIRDAAGVSID